MKRITFLFSILFLITACQSEKLDETLLHGNWQGTEWKVQGEERVRDAVLVTFRFNVDKTYTGKFGAQTENGTYQLSGNKLYTTETDKAKKMVELSKLTQDSLVMQMNRVGTLETLILIKK